MESGSHEDAQAGSEDDYVQRENGTFASCDLLGIFCICAHYCTLLTNHAIQLPHSSLHLMCNLKHNKYLYLQLRSKDKEKQLANC